jgi:hypothetical protein
MRCETFPLLACLLATTGCVTTFPFVAERTAVETAAAPPASEPREAAPLPAPTVAASKLAAASGAAVGPPPLPQPDAVIILDPGSGALDPEMEARLAAVAAAARADERIVLRLESYAPNGGSASLNLLKAERSLQLVRKRLVDMDISPRRILLAPYGGQYTVLRDAHRHWVEIHLIRPTL